MGCITEKPVQRFPFDEMYESEQVITRHEYASIFAKIDVTLLEKAFHGYSKGSQLSQSQLQAICFRLVLNIEDLQEDVPQIRQFLQTLKIGTLYSHDKLRLALILLAKGTGEEKAQAIYRLIDPTEKGIDIETMAEFVNLLADVTLNCVPYLSIGETQEFLSQEKYLTYIQMLLYGRSHYLRLLPLAIIQNQREMTSHAFVRELQKPERKHLVMTFGFRLLLYKRYQSLQCTLQICVINNMEGGEYLLETNISRARGSDGIGLRLFKVELLRSYQAMHKCYSYCAPRESEEKCQKSCEESTLIPRGNIIRNLTINYIKEYKTCKKNQFNKFQSKSGEYYKAREVCRNALEEALTEAKPKVQQALKNLKQVSYIQIVQITQRNSNELMQKPQKSSRLCEK